MDTRQGSGVTYGNDTANGHQAFGVDWFNVDYFNATAPNHVSKLDSFQLVLINRAEVQPGAFDIEFDYGGSAGITWETGDASGGSNGLGGTSARAGFTSGSNAPGGTVELAGSGVNGAFLNSNQSTGLINNSLNSGGVLGRYVFAVRDTVVAQPDSYSVLHGQTLTVSAAGVLANDSDSFGVPLTASVVSNPAHGSLTLNPNGSFTYVSNRSFVGIDTFTYQASDSYGNSATATVTINVTDTAPVANNDSYQIAGSSLSVSAANGVLANDSDADHDPLTAILVSGPSHGSLTLNSDGSFLYTPNGFTGSDSFSYQANDGALNSNTATVTISDPGPVSNGNPNIYATLSGQALSISAAAGVLSNYSGPPGSQLTASLVSGPSHGSLTLHSDGSFSYIPVSGYNGADSFVFQVSDGLVTSQGTVTLSVLNASTLQRSDDPQNALLLPAGEAQVDLNQGGLRLSQALDFDKSPGTDVGRNPALVYNSSTVDVRPIIKVVLPADASQPAPRSLQLRLTFNGVQQNWVSFNAANYQPGQSYVLAVQVANPVTATGLYNWQIDLQADYGNGQGPQPAGSLTGQTPVVVRDSSPYGAGWGIDGLDSLVPVAGGVLWVTGAGDSRLFTANGGSFISPAEDTGSLVQNGDGTYTYTTLDQTRWQFAANGLLSAVTDTHGLSISYLYDNPGRLLQVNSSDGGVSTLAYSNGFLAAVNEPGNRQLTFTQNISSGGASATLAGLVDAAGNPRTFGYDAQHRLVSDSWQPYQSAFSYDATTGLLTTVNLSQGVIYGVTAAAGQGLQTNALLNASQEAVATFSDALNETTTYDLDTRGRPTFEQDADGATQTWVRNARGQVTAYTDARQATTNYHYDTAGDLTEQDNPDGSSVSYRYDPVFHQVTQETTTVATGETDTTVNTYDPTTGDLLTQTTAAGTVEAATTTYVWSNGLMQSSTDGDGNETDYSYDSNRRLTARVEHQGNATGPVVSEETYSYDAAGNPSETVNNEGITQDVYDGNNQLLAEDVYAPDGVTLVSASSTAYLASGLVSKTTDGDGNYTLTSYDTAARVTSTATARCTPGMPMAR